MKAKEKQAFLEYLEENVIPITEPRVSYCTECLNRGSETNPCQRKNRCEELPLTEGSWAIKTGAPNIHCLGWRLAPAKKYEPLPQEPDYSLNMYPCLKNFFPLLRLKISERYKKDIAEAIVSALCKQYPDLDSGLTDISPIMRKWNDQLKASGIFRLSGDSLEEAILTGIRRKKPSCTQYNSTYPLRKQCTPHDCSEHDKTIKRPPDITKRLQKEITSVTVFKGDDTEMTNDEYTIYIRENSITFSHKQLINPKTFIERYYQVFGDLLPITHGEWQVIANTIIKQKITSTIVGETVGTEKYFQELFANGLRGLGRVYSWKEFNRNDMVHDTTDSILWVEKDIVNDIKEKIGLKCNARRLRIILNPIIRHNVKQKRAGGDRYFFWRFDAKKLGIKPSMEKLDSYMEKQKE